MIDALGHRAWMAYGERKSICDRYKVGDFERKGQRTIRSILEAHAESVHASARLP